MKVLQVINSLAIGGAEKLIRETVPLLVKKGFKVDVVLLNGVKTHLYHELNNLDCCKIHTLGKSVYNPLNILKILPLINKYDLVHVHLFPAQYFVVIAKIISFSKVKLIFTEHNTTNKRLQNKHFRSVDKIVYKFYKRILCITCEVRESLIEKLEIPESKLQVVENGVNLNFIYNAVPYARSEFGYDRNQKLIVMTAAFRDQKDHNTLLRALSLLADNYHLILIGDGANKTKVENYINELNISSRVKLLGNRSDVYSIIKMCDIAVLSSNWEGFGLVAVESMACEIPTIGSDVPGLNNVIGDGGLLFERGNDLELKQKIESLEDIQFYKEIASNGLRKAQNYDLNLMVNKLINIYKSL
ncbi:glycosyltransferase [Chryseobacterium taklimakanense]|uniref:Glycosyltransferase n=1 Tax=Chryseobacterium taklimakanense TaxID=536441 RepID=A0A3G8WHT5_9FLAO|nr:glycosyltransferase [Chryseobacterium taklimakanense]AZI19818.1 glycosyltransferase [Chryseobacterium taklimakanense]